MPLSRPRGILSVDVEDYFQVEAFAGIVDRRKWDDYQPRVEANTRRVLDLFDECGVKATFFTLGWVAERFPALVREIAERGHEPAVHSYWHRMVWRLTPREFREDTRRAKDAVEQACGAAARGYRAPSYSIRRDCAWAMGVLAETGFEYDSSIFPVRHDLYGIPDAPRHPFLCRAADVRMLEFPITTFRLGIGPNFPVAGGGYLRVLPFAYTRFGVRRAAAEGLPVITYIHPWEIDPHQPRLDGGRLSRFRHYTNLERMEERIRKLCAMVDYRPFRDAARGIDTASLAEWSL